MAVFRKNDAWWIDYYYQGCRYRQKIGSRRRDADEAMSRIKVKIASGDFVTAQELEAQNANKPKVPPFQEFADEEFLPWSEVEHSASHHKELRRMLGAYVYGWFEGLTLSEVTSKRIEDYKRFRSLARHRRKGWKRYKSVKPATVNRELACIKLVFRKAVEWGQLEHSPAVGAKQLREVPSSPRLLEKSEIVQLLEELPDHLKVLVGVVVYAGLRKQEVFRLRWKDVNLKDSELEVVSREGSTTKNYRSRRIPINPALEILLRRHPRRLGCELVFPNDRGQAYNNINTALKSACDRAGMSPQVRNASTASCLLFVCTNGWGRPANGDEVDGTPGSTDNPWICPRLTRP